MRLRFLSLLLFALLSGPVGWVSAARVKNLGGSIPSVAQLPGATFAWLVDAAFDDAFWPLSKLWEGPSSMPLIDSGESGEETSGPPLLHFYILRESAYGP